ncbi:MAG: putative toxin-antitoxin system toxin component, PIN family [Rhodocyclales bacterium]|nr:putative toxin-antitoxin system toxin component, PIN family [Rhodocyclales bacterium]
MKRPRVVIDTNLVLSALVFAGGRLAPLRLAWQDLRVLPLVSRTTAAELIRALACPKFKLAAHEQEELLADYLPYCKTERIPVPPPATPRCRDAFDVPFLELALAGKADALISGDKDLLRLNGKLACPILGAERFLDSIDAYR